MDQTTDRIRELQAQAQRYDADRYPVQHATAQFHLGATLHAAGRLAEGEAALAVAVAGFDPALLPREHGVACNALGSLVRDGGRPALAVELFRRAIVAFEAAEAGAELGAAWFNLGLALRDLGDRRAAVEAFSRAGEHLDEAAVPASAGAAARELGACHLEDGDIDAALAALERAVDLADRGNDPTGVGAAANVAGLAHLAADDPESAAAAFARSAASLPRNRQPAAHAMALANLALAHERRHDTPRARLAAAQALAVDSADVPVREQAQAILDRLGSPTGDVLTVLDDEPEERWPAIVRAEVARWATLPMPERTDELAAWVDGQLARPGVDVSLAAVLVGTYLEVPPDILDRLVTATVAAAEQRPDEDRVRFRQQVSRALARYPMPQWMRLRDLFNRAAGEEGWG